MDEESFRKELYHSFAAKGIPDILKLHMRNSLVKNLQQKGTPQPKHELSSTLSQKICDKLVYRHLHKSRYSYTLSLFAPEAGLSTADLSSSLEEILQLLNVHPGSVAFKKIKDVLVSDEGSDITGIGGSDLWVVIKSLLSCFGGEHDGSKNSVSVQTGSSVFDKSSALTFSDKMRAIDEEFEERERLNEVTLAEKLTMMRREMEGRYEEQLNAELQRIRENEVTKVRLELEDKFRGEIATIKAQLECKYEERLLALQRREETSLESTRVKMQTIEKEAYAKRQFLLEQVESIRKREIALNRQNDLQQRNIGLMEAKVGESEKALEAREASLRQLEANYEARLYQGEKRIRDEVKTEYVSRMASLEQEEERLKQQKSSIEASNEKLKRLTEIELNMEQLKVELDSAMRQNEINQERLQEMSDYHKIRQDNIYLNEEVDTLKRNMDEIIAASKLNTERNMMSRALSEQGPSLVGSYASARKPTSRGVPPLNIDDEANSSRPMVAQASIDSQTSAVIRQMATELAQLKMQMNANARQQPPLPNQLAGSHLTTSHVPSAPGPSAMAPSSVQPHVGASVPPTLPSANIHNDSTLLHDDLPDISTTSSGKRDSSSQRKSLESSSSDHSFVFDRNQHQ